LQIQKRGHFKNVENTVLAYILQIFSDKKI